MTLLEYWTVVSKCLSITCEQLAQWLSNYLESFQRHSTQSSRRPCIAPQQRRERQTTSRWDAQNGRRGVAEGRRPVDAKARRQRSQRQAWKGGDAESDCSILHCPHVSRLQHAEVSRCHDEAILIQCQCGENAILMWYWCEIDSIPMRYQCITDAIQMQYWWHTNAMPRFSCGAANISRQYPMRHI